MVSEVLDCLDLSGVLVLNLQQQPTVPDTRDPLHLACDVLGLGTVYCVLYLTIEEVVLGLPHQLLVLLSRLLFGLPGERYLVVLDECVSVVCGLPLDAVACDFAAGEALAL
jgi:hypothetical protein